ncbi:putative transporter [Pseudocercospora fuligena]|uniref:Putative transporter n=1 Tax=Pseudocercospora fuligena TaxID=685502 RepID=A0A8H6R6W4_9PEZI|nr:putative transporter [Pseudocercospora fuligena]
MGSLFAAKEPLNLAYSMATKGITQISETKGAESINKTPTDSRDLDDTYQLYRNQDGAELNEVEAKRVLRKIDLKLLPLLMGTYMLQYLDKSSINFASVYGLREGTNLQGQQYAWLGSIFYFGYLVAQYPAGYALQRLPTAKFIGCTILAWGILTIVTPACSSFAGIATTRFLLGVFEGVVNPGLVLVMAMWYRKEEQPLRLVIYYCMNGIAVIFGGLLGYAIGHITTGLERWMYVFLIFGAVSIAWGIVFLLSMPDLPSVARFLSADEQIVAIERVAANRQGVKNHHFKWDQAKQAALDPKTWILFIMSVAGQIPNAAHGTFLSIILKSFGFTSLQTQYMQMPGAGVQIVSLLASGYIASRWPNMRCTVMIIGNLACVACGGALVGLDVDQHWGRLVALWLCGLQSVGFALSLTMVSSNVAGYTKKQLTGAAVFVGYCVGNIIGPQTFIESEAPAYTSAYIAILIGYSVKTVMVIILYAYMWAVNKKRDREVASLSPEARAAIEKEAIERGMQDATELDNKGFRYSL